MPKNYWSIFPAITHPMIDRTNKENYNPALKMYSPKRLENQKRYQILKELTQRSHNVDTAPERVEASAQEEPFSKDIEFEDETIRRFGL